ncbi:MAG TPA: transporter [Methylococcus sp.]|nr:transporter [Methylococcus sp.]
MGFESKDTGGIAGLDWLLRWLEGEPGQETGGVDIATPGPDLANFPNSSYTLRRGEFYFETTPVNMNGPSGMDPFNYNWELFLRYGLNDNIEARLYTSGLTYQGGDRAALGFSPLTFDTKIHVGEADWGLFNFSFGLEAYVQTTWLTSPAFNGGTQYSLTTLFDHRLPGDFSLEWNLGFVRSPDPAGGDMFVPSIQWALQRNLTEDFALFVQGYENATALPRTFHHKVRGVPEAEATVLGGGFQWLLDRRWAVFGSINSGWGRVAPSYNLSLGFAVAF